MGKKGKKGGAAARLGRKGGRIRASHLTREQRSEQARHAAMKRWEDAKKKTEEELFK